MKVLVADDAILFRRLLAEVLSLLPGVEVVGSAGNGKIALQKVLQLKPDLLTLDIEMPEMDGLAVLDALRRSDCKVEVIVVSALSHRGGALAMRALEKGAFDFIAKPDCSTLRLGRETLLRELTPRVRAVAHRMEVRNILRGNPASMRPNVPLTGATSELAPADSRLDGISTRMQRITNPSKPEMVLIGVSTGGPVALARLLPCIPRDIGVPIVIVQHMPPIFTKSLADNLSAKCAVTVCEATHGESLQPNTVYIAPGGRQMRLRSGPGNRAVVELTDDPPENNCRPSVDYLFRSAAHNFPGRSMAVILTGMGSDGTLGLRLLKRSGCYVIAQDEASCVVYGMPRAAVDAGMADAVMPLESIAQRIAAVVREGRP